MKRYLEFSAAGLVLVVATLSIWHWRFVAIPNALPKLELTSPLIGWKAKSYTQHDVVEKNGKLVLRLGRESLSEKLPSIHVWLGENGGLDGVAAVHIRCKVRWEGVKVGPVGYMNARIVTMMRDVEGKVMHPPDFGVTSGLGTRDWHHCEAVFKVTDDMEDFGIEISMLGSEGLMEVKDLSVVAVRDRDWVSAATGLILGGWIILVSFLIRCHENAPDAWRAVAASVAVVAVSWFFVFPQTKGQLFPVLGSFAVGGLQVSPQVADSSRALPAPAEPDQKPASAVDPSRPIAVVSEQPIEPEEEPDVVNSPLVAEPHTEKPEPVAHSSGALHKFLRVVDKRLPVAHVGLFLGVTILVIFLTGRGNQWRIPLALAVLSELVPELTNHLGGWDDWTDVLQNFVGVGLAVILWRYVPALLSLSPLKKLRG